MPATVHIRLPVDEHEHDEISKRAEGSGSIAAYLRKLLGLPPRKSGRPRKSAAKPKK